MHAFILAAVLALPLPTGLRSETCGMCQGHCWIMSGNAQGCWDVECWCCRGYGTVILREPTRRELRNWLPHAIQIQRRFPLPLPPVLLQR